jgi:hypothetical protein
VYRVAVCAQLLDREVHIKGVPQHHGVKYQAEGTELVLLALAIALSQLATLALQLVGGADYLKTFGTDQLRAQMIVLLSAFQSGWDLALIIFGLHLFVLGLLVFGSSKGKALRVLGILVIAAGLGYIVDGCGKLLLPDYSLTVGAYTFVGEALLMFWLLWKGIRGTDSNRAMSR